MKRCKQACIRSNKGGRGSNAHLAILLPLHPLLLNQEFNIVIDLPRNGKGSQQHGGGSGFGGAGQAMMSVKRKKALY